MSDFDQNKKFFGCGLGCFFAFFAFVFVAIIAIWVVVGVVGWKVGTDVYSAPDVQEFLHGPAEPGEQPADKSAVEEPDREQEKAPAEADEDPAADDDAAPDPGDSP